MLELTHRRTDRRRLLLSKLLLVAAVVAGLALNASTLAQGATDPPAGAPPEAGWKSSPFHGVIGGDGNVIPCRCLFRGTAYKLGERVCMNTHLGTVITECDLQLNNTSWIPTKEPCTTS